MTNKEYMQYIDKSHKYYAEPKKPDTKEYIVYYSTCTKFRGTQNYITVIKIQNTGLLGGRWVH